MAASTPPPSLDPPFRGYIETTFDALLVFEAARRGMIPRVTRRLIERERGMVQSGAVFVFDEHESGIKRWTDGLVWSPSRILGNFLVSINRDRANSRCIVRQTRSHHRPGHHPRHLSRILPLLYLLAICPRLSTHRANRWTAYWGTVLCLVLASAVMAEGSTDSESVNWLVA